MNGYFEKRGGIKFNRTGTQTREYSVIFVGFISIQTIPSAMRPQCRLPVHTSRAQAVISPDNIPNTSTDL